MVLKSATASERRADLASIRLIGSSIATIMAFVTVIVLIAALLAGALLALAMMIGGGSVFIGLFFVIAATTAVALAIVFRVIAPAARRAFRRMGM
jgi:hypothetical protein